MDDTRGLTGPWLVLAGLRLLAELGMLTALAYVGWSLAGDHQAVGIVLAVVLVGTASAGGVLAVAYLASAAVGRRGY